MTGVESFVKCGEGEHVVKVLEAKEGVSQAGNDVIQLKLQVLKGSSKDAIVYDNLTLTEKALWRTKQFLDALGMKSDGKLVIDLDKIEGKTCIISVIHEEYQGKTKAKVDEFKKLAAAKSDDDWEDDEDDDEDDDWDEDMEDDVDDEEEVDEPEPPKKKAKPAPKKEEKKSKAKPAPKKPEPEEDEDDEWDEEDDEWDEE